ncbi:MAG: dihydroorotate dehydrogenase electron transfer subunit [archaeon]
MNRPEVVSITKVVQHAPDIRTFILSKSFSPRAGQFCMVWVPGTGEIPMSFSHENGFTVRKVGKVSSALFKMKPGDKLGIRGPYGNGFKLKGKSALIVAGGCGVAPLLLLNKQLKAKKAVIQGGSTKRDLVFKGELGSIKCTDDGSEGYKGFPTSKVEELLNKTKFDQIYTCGPEAMMAKVVEIGARHRIPVQASLERYMKCACGICGSCVLDPSGLLVCKDGPVFTGRQLRGTSFGKTRRSKSGKKCTI